MTRYLCAAAHLDAEFADRAIAEYLVEPTRALPPSLGVDTVTVLREAVAARARRRVRDAVLVVAAAVFTVFCAPLALAWTVAAVVVEVLGARGGPVIRFVAAVLAAIAGAVLLVVYGSGFVGALTYLLYATGLPVPALSVAPVVLPIVVIVGVLVVDELAVTELTRHDFRARNFVADAASLPKGRQQSLRTWGNASHSASLARVAAREDEADAAGAAERVDVVVHRTPDPFVGAGDPLRNNIALPLVPDEEADRPPVEFRPSELHDHVAAALSTLRDSGSLAPGGRLADLSIIEQVFLPAEQMLRESGTTLLRTVLPDPARPPVNHLPRDVARSLADEPQEAARYYCCYRVESWDRDLATSTYFTVGTDQRTLYLEWTHCVLPPIRAAFRDIDRHADTGPVRRAFESAVTFPLSLPHRLVGLFRRFRPLPHGPDEIEPGRYGAGWSLRELAAAPRAEMFFQRVDAVRYLTVVEQAILKAVEEFLTSRCYSVTDILGVARQKISNSITVENGVFHNSSLVIGSNRQHAAPSPSGAAQEQK